jgi:excisionase family DNA binding protein
MRHVAKVKPRTVQVIALLLAFALIAILGGCAGKSCHPLASVTILAEGGRYMPDEILTLPEVAQLLKVADKTVYTMAQRGELPAFKVRGQWRFKHEDLDQWIEAQKAVSREPGAETR